MTCILILFLFIFLFVIYIQLLFSFIFYHLFFLNRKREKERDGLAISRLIRRDRLYKILRDNKSYSEIIALSSTRGLWKFAARHSVVLTVTRYNEARTDVGRQIIAACCLRHPRYPYYEGE